MHLKRNFGTFKIISPEKTMFDKKNNSLLSELKKIQSQDNALPITQSPATCLYTDWLNYGLFSLRQTPTHLYMPTLY